MHTVNTTLAIILNKRGACPPSTPTLSTTVKLFDSKPLRKVAHLTVFAFKEPNVSSSMGLWTEAALPPKGIKISTILFPLLLGAI